MSIYHLFKETPGHYTHEDLATAPDETLRQIGKDLSVAINQMLEWGATSVEIKLFNLGEEEHNPEFHNVFFKIFGTTKH